MKIRRVFDQSVGYINERLERIIIQLSENDTENLAPITPQRKEVDKE